MTGIVEGGAKVQQDGKRVENGFAQQKVTILKKRSHGRLLVDGESLRGHRRESEGAGSRNDVK